VPQGSPQPAGQSGSVPPPPGPGIPNADTTSTDVKEGSSQILQVFFLVAILAICVFLGYFYFYSYRLTLRIQRLEALLEKFAPPPLSIKEPSMFSWQEALKGFEKGWVLFSPEYRYNSPGIVGIVCDNPNLAFNLSVNIIYNTVNEMNQAVIYLSGTRGENDLGKALLTMESGTNIENLEPGQREEIISRFSLEMTKYETGLFIFRDYNIKPEDLYTQVSEIAQHYETGCIIIEKSDVLEKSDFFQLLQKLRLLAVRIHIPIVLIDNFSGNNPAQMREDHKDNFIVLLGVEESDKEDSIRIKSYKLPGENLPEVIPVNKATGKIG
jgi:hypothetical protein